MDIWFTTNMQIRLISTLFIRCEMLGLKDSIAKQSKRYFTPREDTDQPELELGTNVALIEIVLFSEIKHTTLN